MIKLGFSSQRAANQLWRMCQEDTLFYINTFGYTYDPRVNPPVLPFITYPFQDDIILEMEAALGDHDMVVEKSRDMGLSWICIYICEKDWHFNPFEVTFLMVSRKEDLVDKAEDPKTLFWKIDFILSHLPAWLTPKFKRQKLHLLNYYNGSTVDGESTTGDVARGDRRKAIFFDEFASVDDGRRVLAASADSTDCRIFNSTPKGVANAFYELTKTQDPKTVKFRAHWSTHPKKAKGLYTSKQGRLSILDEKHRFPDNYKFILDGKLRSPWYDGECVRRISSVEIAQELDIDYLGSGYQFFSPEMLDKVKAKYCIEPFHLGELRYDHATCKPTGFIENGKGPWRLWFEPNADGKPVDDRNYVVSVDVAVGTGSSNSTISVYDLKLKEKVAEYADAYIQPHELARLAVAACKYFGGASLKAQKTRSLEGWAINSDAGGAFLIWENNGHGAIFGKTVFDDLAYRNVYYRSSVSGTSLSVKKSKSPGWHTTKDNKVNLLGAYAKALGDEEIINRSSLALSEAYEYIFTDRQSVEHAVSAKSEDPTGARHNHGDRVIADALAVEAMKEVIPLEKSEEKVILPGSLAFRRRRREEAEKEKAFW